MFLMNEQRFRGGSEVKISLLKRTCVVLPPQSFSVWTSGLHCCSEQRPTGHSGPHIITAEESFGNRLDFNLLNITLVCNRCTSSRVIMTSAEEHREGRTTSKTINLSSCARSFGKDTIGKHPVWNQNWAWPWFLTSFFYDSPFKISNPPLAVRCLATFSQISKNITKSFLFFSFYPLTYLQYLRVYLQF